jgi:hypothetical protein
MSIFELILIFAGFAVAMLPLGIMLGGNLMEQWQNEQQEKEEEQ